MTGAAQKQTANRRLIVRLLAVVFAMFGFGFALVPLYDLFCDITGLNGKTGVTDKRTINETRVDEDRWVTVEFTGNVASGLPWEFRPSVLKIQVHPGAVAKVVYVARNAGEQATVGRAIPSVTPGKAAAYFKKIECFCFSEQTLEAGERKEMPVQFVVERDLPKEVNTITLSYAFFNTEQYVTRDTVKTGHEAAKDRKMRMDKDS